MMKVTLYSKLDQSLAEVKKLIEILDGLQAQYPHEFLFVDVRKNKWLSQHFPGQMQVDIDGYLLNDPIDERSCALFFAEVAKRRQAIEDEGNALNQQQLEEKNQLSGGERFTLWFSRHYLALFNLLLLLYVGIAFMAPVLMKIGLTGAGTRIYAVYRPFCHQLAYRSFFFFGEQIEYPAGVKSGSNIRSFEQASGISASNSKASSDFVGNERLGYKTAMCQRDMAIYGSLLLAGLLFAAFRDKVKPLHWALWILLALGPMGLDGVTQLIGQFNLSFLAWLPVRESNMFLRVLTGAMFAFFSVWFAYPSMEESLEPGRISLEKKALLKSHLQKEQA